MSDEDIKETLDYFAARVEYLKDMDDIPTRIAMKQKYEPILSIARMKLNGQVISRALFEEFRDVCEGGDRFYEWVEH